MRAALPPSAPMSVVSEVVSRRSMDFANQRKVVIKRDQGWTWSDIAADVRTVSGLPPSETQVRDVYRTFDRRAGRKKYKYSACGRRPWKVTPEVERFLVKKLLSLRGTCICTSTTLQRELKRDMDADIAKSTICKALQKKGYKWLPRAQKPRYSKDDRDARLAFAQEVVKMSARELEKYLALCMDGVVLSVPPVDPVERSNFVHIGETHMWRKSTEAAKKELSGNDDFDKQVPLKRAVPLWGGIGAGGFGIVTFRKKKKLCQEEWVKALRAGKLVAACRQARPDRTNGPWRVLCDNESFLDGRDSKREYAKTSVQLWHVPPRSPDLNPVERFRAFLRKRLRAMDMKDLKDKKPPVGKAELKRRVRMVVQTKTAKETSKRMLRSLLKTAQIVIKKKGAASGR